MKLLTWDENILSARQRGSLYELQTSPPGLRSEMVPALREKFGENVLQETNKKANYLFFLFDRLKRTEVQIIIGNNTGSK
jgi:hypothetical protein